MSKIKKIIFCVFLVLILTLPVLTVAAVEDESYFVDIQGTDKVYLMDDSKSYFSLNFAAVSILRDGVWYDVSTVTGSASDGGLTVKLHLKNELGTLQKNDRVLFDIVLSPSSDMYMDRDYNVTGSLIFGMKLNASEFYDYSVTRADGSYIQDADIYSVNTDWGEYYKAFFGNSIGRHFEEYRISIDYRIAGYPNDYGSYIYLKNFDFTAVHQDDYTTDKIISNENKNHDELINGRDYADVDGSTINDYGAADAELNSATASAQSDSISFINNFGNLFGSSHVHKGLLAVSAITKELFAINWVSDILSFALGLGCFAFILGTSYLLISRASSNERYKQSREFRRYSKKGGGG